MIVYMPFLDIPSVSNMQCTNSASAALNKWMKEKLSDSDYVIHGFRHSMRDRLRAVECPSDIIDKNWWLDNCRSRTILWSRLSFRSY